MAKKPVSVRPIWSALIYCWTSADVIRIKETRQPMMEFNMAIGESKNGISPAVRPLREIVNCDLRRRGTRLRRPEKAVVQACVILLIENEAIGWFTNLEISVFVIKLAINLRHVVADAAHC